MIAIIGAMDVEIDGLRDLMQDCSVKTINFFNFYMGRIGKNDVVVIRCGIGKVNAAAATAVLLNNFNVSEVVNIGIAGGVSNKVKALDIVVATKVIQYDIDLTPLGFSIGQTERGSDAYFACSRRLINSFGKIIQGHAGYAEGVIATGDRFVSSDSDIKKLETEFCAVACDMESGAIAQVAKLFNKDFISIRTVSDNANDNAACDYKEFEQKAASKSIEIIAKYLSQD